MVINLKDIILGRSELALLQRKDGIYIAPKNEIKDMAEKSGIPYGLFSINLPTEKENEQAAREMLMDIVSGQLNPLRGPVFRCNSLIWNIKTK